MPVIHWRKYGQRKCVLKWIPNKFNTKAYLQTEITLTYTYCRQAASWRADAVSTRARFSWTQQFIRPLNNFKDVSILARRVGHMFHIVNLLLPNNFNRDARLACTTLLLIYLNKSGPFKTASRTVTHSQTWRSVCVYISTTLSHSYTSPW